LPHVVVSLDEQFRRDLPTYVVEASRLSGGLASLGQAHEVYFYRQLKGLGSRRLSGILGNQSDDEAWRELSSRNASFRFWAHTLGIAGSVESSEHWLALAFPAFGAQPAPITDPV